MKRLNIAKKQRVAFVRKCLKSDVVDGKEFCIYKEDTPLTKQPKGFPKHFKTKGEADEYLQQMEMFKDITDKKKGK